MLSQQRTIWLKRGIAVVVGFVLGSAFAQTGTVQAQTVQAQPPAAQATVKLSEVEGAAVRYLLSAVFQYEKNRREGRPSIPVSIPCTDALLRPVRPELPRSVTACSVLQTGKGTYGYVTAANGKSFQFDGQAIRVNTPASLPAQMP